MLSLLVDERDATLGLKISALSPNHAVKTGFNPYRHRSPTGHRTGGRTGGQFGLHMGCVHSGQIEDSLDGGLGFGRSDHGLNTPPDLASLSRLPLKWTRIIHYMVHGDVWTVMLYARGLRRRIKHSEDEFIPVCVSMIVLAVIDRRYSHAKHNGSTRHHPQQMRCQAAIHRRQTLLSPYQAEALKQTCVFDPPVFHGSLSHARPDDLRRIFSLANRGGCCGSYIPRADR